ncbi:MAG: glycosyltransferase, partial [Bdellovibrionales bacterium]|nr:glycosyltransferase [Bdellovibrionales bacterium]
GMNIFGRIVRARKPRGEDVQAVFMPDGSSFLFDRDLLGEPYESDYFIYHEDAALGWRARLQGFEVLVNPRSLARTFDEGSTRRIPYRTAFYTERNRWLNRLVFPSWWTKAILVDWWGLEWLAGMIAGRNRRARLHALWWVIVRPCYVRRLRARMQALRRVPDSEILCHIHSAWFSGEPGGWRGWINRFLHGYFSFFGLKFKP